LADDLEPGGDTAGVAVWLIGSGEEGGGPAFSVLAAAGGIAAWPAALVLLRCVVAQAVSAAQTRAIETCAVN
jgi:hypothetical protein